VRYSFTRRLDTIRHCRARFGNTLFIYNAVRKPQEIGAEYGAFRYVPVKPVSFRCQVIDDTEAMFRPAVYGISDYVPINKESILPENIQPCNVLSMIGYYRNVARKGQQILVSGVLERVENVEMRETSFQAVVGTARSENERILPFSSRGGSWV